MLLAVIISAALPKTDSRAPAVSKVGSKTFGI
jgi:hypothetical protein